MSKANKKLVLVKLGGSVITDKSKPYTARVDVIRRLGKELKKVEKDYQIIISHGSGSFGHTSAKKYGGSKGYKSKLGISKVSFDVQQINLIVTKALIEEGLPAISLRPMSMILTEEGEIKKNIFEIIEEMLRQDLIPVVYGDVIWDKKWKSVIYSGEKFLNRIASHLLKKGFKIDKIIQVGQTDGVYEKNKKTIPVITKKNWPKAKKHLYETSSDDVTGGMSHKIEDALLMADQGIKTLLINGNTPNELVNAFCNKKTKGTLIS
ncbi:MAG: isopentenyl phosphate kinase [Patescibacteria group bacterium]